MPLLELRKRVNDELLSWLTGTRLTPVMVIHANHAQELDDEVAAALRRLTTAGVLPDHGPVALAYLKTSQAVVGTNVVVAGVEGTVVALPFC